MKERIEQIARECGFECFGWAPASKLKTRQEVRDMCAAGRCQIYGHSWACPPACGDIEYFQNRINEYSDCLIVQSVGELEDEFDFETMIETEATHKERFVAFANAVREVAPDAFFLAAGTCTICKKCTYPDEPCRFPERQLSSMEAAGLVVSDACKEADIPYNHGKGTLAYSSAVLLNG